MIERLLAVSAITFLFGSSGALAVDGKGLTDGSVYDHTGVSPYEPTRAEHEARQRVKPLPDDDYAYRTRCYWTVKTTDGWWPTGATQVCFRERVN